MMLAVDHQQQYTINILQMANRETFFAFQNQLKKIYISILYYILCNKEQGFYAYIECFKTEDDLSKYMYVNHTIMKPVDISFEFIAGSEYWLIYQTVNRWYNISHS